MISRNSLNKIVYNLSHQRLVKSFKECWRDNTGGFFDSNQCKDK